MTVPVDILHWRQLHMTWQTRHEIARQEALALRHLYRAHGYIPQHQPTRWTLT